MRSEFGTITFRKNAAGEATSLKVRYVNPLNPSKRVLKSFPLGSKAIAQAWLDSEERYRDECRRDGVRWLSPKEREEADKKREIPFREYARKFLDSYRTADGRELEEGSRRKKRESVAHLDEFFGDMPVSGIDEETVDRWFDGEHAEGQHAFRRSYQTLKAICRKAVREGILEAQPCVRPNPKLPRSGQAEIPPASREELGLIYEAMPDYLRIAVYLGAVFGLRISEVCALQRRDFDFKHGLLHVRHSIGRGEGDVGGLVLKATKTESSNADLPIPSSFVPMLKSHLAAFCDPDSDAMVIRPRKAGIMSPNSLRDAFDRARLAADRPDLHFHTLRATAITAAAVVGGTPKEVQRYGRHADAEISLSLYQRATEGGGRRLSDKVFEALVVPERTRGLVAAELEDARRQLREAEDRVRRLTEELESKS